MSRFWTAAVAAGLSSESAVVEPGRAGPGRLAAAVRRSVVGVFQFSSVESLTPRGRYSAINAQWLAGGCGDGHTVGPAAAADN